jgi:hypothetical protein
MTRLRVRQAFVAQRRKEAREDVYKPAAAAPLAPAPAAAAAGAGSGAGATPERKRAAHSALGTPGSSHRARR